MNHLNLFKEKNIIADLKAGDKREVLEEMVEYSIEKGLLAKTKKKAVIEALLEREKLGSTGLGNGIAIPHVKIKGFQGDLALVARSKSGIDFKSVDGEPVIIFFLLVSSTEEAENHLSILQWISGLARHQDFKSFIRGAADGKEILGILKEIGG
jgi:mannitol/fructose-specific phosphotransferase system IIA component (Ntr-type)